MADHVMVEAVVPGFKTQCKFCGALDTEVKFSRSNHCAVLTNLEQREAQEIPVIQIMVPTQEQQTIMMQAAWFDGYAHRQMMRTVK